MFSAALYLIFFCSGAAALLFETLWFRQAGLMLGNTVWASSLVTASFMAGLAIGNGVAARYGRKIRRPLTAYALFEIAVGVTGVALVLGFPFLTAALAPLLGTTRSLLTLNVLRVGASFCLLVIPASAMGATLPLLARALSAHDPNFGRVLGRLYGWNTLGAFAGALAGEVYLIGALGVRGTAFFAAGLDILAAGAVWALGSRWVSVTLEPAAPALAVPRLGARQLRLLGAAFVTGGVLLALEVFWFRFLQLFIRGTTLTFAVMLAVVLLGIALGGLIGSVWLARQRDAHTHAPLVALLAGIAVITSYAFFPRALASYGVALVVAPVDVFWLSLQLMLPVCVLSGLIFTFLGKALQEDLGDEARATGALTLANTVGAMLGALLAGFVLLPGLGVERSFFAVGLTYGAAALLALPAVERLPRLARVVAWGLFAVVVALFPFGTMNRRYLRILAVRWFADGYQIAALKEGLSETVSIFQKDAFGQPLAFRLVTNGIGLSATGVIAGRYMGLFVWWPVALHPAPKNALLICHGLGTTARALTDTRALESIDIVDISRDVLEMSGIAFPKPGTNPLADPRVTTHVEDGRFFLLTTDKKYDIITAEPPPPKTAGVTNLYSTEYFRLMRDRLAPGGIATYWLPVYQLETREMKSVIKGFCLAFDDCSLWTGYGYEWMLVGTRGAAGPATEESFARQWRDPQVAPRLKAAALEGPEHLGALFLADADTLRALSAAEPPLDDDHPYRLSPRNLQPLPDPFYAEMMDVPRARARFERSELVARLWPPSWRQKSLAAFDVLAPMNRYMLVQYAGTPPPALAELETLLTRTALETVVLWYMSSSAEEQEIAAAAAARGNPAPEVCEVMGVGAMARRDYRGAEAWFARAEPFAERADVLRQWRILAAGLAGDTPTAGRLLAEAGPLVERPGIDPKGWGWLAQRFGIAMPARVLLRK
jgi:spermidine synthase